MNVLMVGVDESTKGGMWTVVENYLTDEKFVKDYNLSYIPTSITGCSKIKRIFFTFSSFIKIIKAYKQTKFSVLHVHMSERASIYRKGLIMKYAKKKGSKIVLHMHGAEFEVLYKKMSKSRQSSVCKIINRADKIIILGEYWRDFISTLVDDPKKIDVVYNAVTVPDKYLYSKKSMNILFLGAVSKRKGIDLLLKALKDKADLLNKKCIVNIYGPKVDYDIEKIIEDYNLSTWVKYSGWLDKNRKEQVLLNTAVNVLPSYNEGLPMTILEAMSYGIPTISTDVAAIPEAVNENNGIIIKPGDNEELEKAILSLITDEEKRLKLSEQAYKDACEKFSIRKHIHQIESIYQELTQ